MKQIRLARGLTLDDLVARMGGLVTKQALSQYESAKAQPRPGVLLQLARALNVSTATLALPSPLSIEFVAFRRKSGMAMRDAQAIQSKIGFELEKRAELQEKLHPEANISFPFRAFPVSIIEDAEDVALQVRDLMGLGRDPIGNVTETLEAHGVHVFALATSDKFDGISAVVKRDGEAVAGGVVTRVGVCGERQRLTGGHEAGHLFMNVQEGCDEELAAFRFGGAFLLPAETLRTEVGTYRRTISLQELLTLKKRYGISIAAILRRMKELEIITPSYYSECCIALSRNGWRKTEPEQLEPETSLWLRQNVLRAHTEGLVTTREAEEMLKEKIGSERPSLTRLWALRNLPVAERNHILLEASEFVADAYRSDLAKPPAERELTAFTALDGLDPILEDETVTWDVPEREH